MGLPLSRLYHTRHPILNVHRGSAEDTAHAVIQTGRQHGIENRDVLLGERAEDFQFRAGVRARRPTGLGGCETGLLHHPNELLLHILRRKLNTKYL